MSWSHFHIYSDEWQVIKTSVRKISGFLLTMPCYSSERLWQSFVFIISFSFISSLSWFLFQMDKNFIFIKVKSNKWRSLGDNPFLSQWLPGTATPAIHSALSLVTDLSCYDGPLHLLLKSADIWRPTCFLSIGSAVGWELPCDFLAILQKQQRLPLGIPLWLPNCPLSFGNSKHSPEGCIESVHPTWTRQLADSSQLSESYSGKSHAPRLLGLSPLEIPLSPEDTPQVDLATLIHSHWWSIYNLLPLSQWGHSDFAWCPRPVVRDAVPRRENRTKGGGQVTRGLQDADGSVRQVLVM